MNIVFTINDAFIPQVAACINSICVHNSSEQSITFFVLGSNISSNNRDLLESYVRGTFQREVRFIDITGFMDVIGFPFDTSGWNEIVLARLLIARFLPETVRRVLYLDGDTIVRHSISSLWNYNLHGSVLGMAPEPTADHKRMRSLGLEGKKYYNAGVLLMDLDIWRRDSVEKRLLSFCKDNAERLYANDQDAINVVLRDEIQPIPVYYNASNIFSYYPYRYLDVLMPRFDSEESYDIAKNDPIIVHYLGEERPWREGNTHAYRLDFLNNLYATPWKNMPLEQGWSMYFVLWRLFNAVSKPLPSIRYFVISSLIPVFMKYRAHLRSSHGKR